MSPLMSHSQENNKGFEKLLSHYRVGSHDCGKCYVLLSYTSFITHTRSEGIKIGNLDSFLRPSSDHTPFRTCSSCTHFEKGCQGNPKQRRLHALKAGKCISTSNLYTLLWLTVFFLSLTGVLKNSHKALHIFFF